MKVVEIDLGLKHIVKELNKLNNKSLEVGVLEGAGSYSYTTKKGKTTEVLIAQVYYWQEFGTSTIPVRATLQPSLEGLHLEQLLKQQKISIIGMYDGASYKEVIKASGEYQKKKIKKLIEIKSNPPNATSTIKKKGFNDPLIWTGKLMNSINWKKI